LSEVNIDHGQNIGRAPQARTLRTRAAILAAARDMAAGGYGALRADGVAQAAGIAKGTVFAHFPDMDHLTAALVAEALAALPPLAPPQDVSGLVAGLAPMLDFMASDPRIIAALARFSGPEGAGLGVDAAICAQAEAVAWAIANLQAQGKVAPGDPGLLAEGIMAFAFHTAASSLCAEAARAEAARTTFERLVTRWLAP
jgi:TetR/AcrR family transcriptional regulator, fatty acid biosynthesis regulator